MSDLQIKAGLSGLFKFKLRSRYLFLPLLILLVALLQTTTIWNFTVDKVDELAIYSHSVGFFGGDFNPHWFDYGSLGMYLNFLVYILLYIPLFLFGKFQSIDEYAMQLFYNGYFVLTSRYLYAILGTIAVFVYAKLARQLKIPIFLIVSFIILSVISIDAIHFANYLRSDILVGFFSALSVYCAIHSKDKKFLYFLAISIAGAICSKISSLPLVGLLVIYLSYRWYDKTIVWKDSITIILTLILFIFLFQPYMNWVERFENLVKLVFESGGSGEGHINWRVDYLDSYYKRLCAIVQVFIEYCSLAVLLTLPLIVFTKRYKTIIIPSVIVLLLLTMPYLISKEITYYWFAPAFNLVRFISLLSLAGFYFTLRDYFEMKNIAAKYLKPGMVALFIILGSIFVLTPDLKNYFKQATGGQANKILAKEWIESNLLEKNNILLEWSVAHVIPTIYDPGSITSSKRISLALFYGGKKNDFLNNLFEDYLENHYCNKLGIESVKRVRTIKSKNNNATVLNKDFRESYYITSKSAYSRILKRNNDDLNPDKKSRLESYKAYHKFMLSNQLVKKFNQGVGPNVEVYKIDSVFRAPDDDFGYLFERERGEIQFNDESALNRDITIDMLVRLNAYPKSWTPIISKFESGIKNEFNFRLKNDKDGHWFYGNGKDAVITRFKPPEIIPLGVWLRITVVRNMVSGELVIYVNNELVKKKEIKNTGAAAITNAPIRLFGKGSRCLDAKIQYLQIWDTALTPLEVDNIDFLPGKKTEIVNLVGYWRFENVTGEIVKDLSGNGNHLILRKQ